MKETALTSACRYCRYYKPEGRRGGSCQMLGAPVQSHWQACSLAASPFTTTWMEIDEILRATQALTDDCNGRAEFAHRDLSFEDRDAPLHLETALSLDYSGTITPKMAENLPKNPKITTD